MKEKILQALKTAYAKLGLSDEAFDGVASLLEKTVTEESEIVTAVSGDNVRNLLKTIQGSVDSWKNKFHDKDKELNAYKQSHPDKNPDPDPAPHQDPDEPPKWFKDYLESQKAEKRQGDLLDSVRKKLEKDGCTNKGILGAVLKGFKAGDDDTADSLAEKFKGEYNTLFEETFGTTPAPLRGTGNVGNANEDAVVASRKAWVDKHIGVKDEKK